MFHPSWVNDVRGRNCPIKGTHLTGAGSGVGEGLAAGSDAGLAFRLGREDFSGGLGFGNLSIGTTKFSSRRCR